MAALLAGVLLVGCGGPDTATPTNPTELPPVLPPVVPGGTPPTTGRIAFVSDRDGVDTIYLANPDGSGARRVVVGVDPDWAPGGRHLAFVRNGAIHTVDVETARVQYVTPGGAPAWSPDGNRIAYALNRRIYVLDFNSADEARVIVDARDWNAQGVEYGALAPSWSPDGRSIAFIRENYDEGHVMFVADVDGTNKPRMLAENAADFTAWSPDGSMIAFASARNIQTVPANGGVPTDVAVGYTADWTPSGGLIFDASAFGQPCCRGLRIYVWGSGGPIIPEAVSAARADYSDRQPAWSR
jgi:Tol biopolymer transport system component